MRADQPVDDVILVLRTFRDDVEEFAQSLYDRPEIRETDTTISALFASVALARLVSELENQKLLFESTERSLVEVSPPPGELYS